MRWTTALAIYFLIWWVCLFAVLPWGVRSQQESGGYAQGTDPGAPASHRVWIKLLATTVIACVIFAVLAFIYLNDLVSLDALSIIAGPRR
jgi:predicted secreted protein